MEGTGKPRGPPPPHPRRASTDHGPRGGQEQPLLRELQLRRRKGTAARAGTSRRRLVCPGRTPRQRDPPLQPQPQAAPAPGCARPRPAGALPRGCGWRAASRNSGARRRERRVRQNFTRRRGTCQPRGDKGQEQKEHERRTNVSHEPKTPAEQRPEHLRGQRHQYQSASSAEEPQGVAALPGKPVPGVLPQHPQRAQYPCAGCTRGRAEQRRTLPRRLVTATPGRGRNRSKVI